MNEEKEFERIRTVQTFNERCQAWNLVYRKYLESGFVGPHASGLLFSLLDLLPSSASWVVKGSNCIEGTMSLVINTTSGLPGGPRYEVDLKQFGIDGRVIGEFTKLAAEDSIASGTLPMKLMATMIGWAIRSHVDDVLCVVHPRHARTWTHVFGWRSLGEVKQHSGVNNAPGILLHLDLKRIPSDFQGMPMRGQRLLRQARERAETTPESRAFRPSGSEAAALLAQCPKLLTSGPLLHRKGIERYYPWASALMDGVLRSFPCQEHVHPNRPWRDRSLVFPNDASRRKLLAGARLSLSQDWDQLLFPDTPMILFIDDGQPCWDPVCKLLEESGLIAVRWNVADNVLDAVRKHMFDLILTPLSNDEAALGEITKFVRERDSNLDFHTPIVNMRDMFGRFYQGSDLLKSDASMTRYMSSLREFARLLFLITTSFDEETAENPDSESTSIERATA